MSSLSQYRIGILEDDLMIAETLADILETLGHQVLFSVNNGESLLKEAAAQEVELLLLDIQVKGDIDGIQTAARLPKGKIPYVFTTAFADTTTLERVKQTAPYGYVIKPYGIKDIEVGIQMAMLNHNRSSESSVESIPESKEHLFVKDNGRLVKIRFDELQFIEAKGDYMVLKCAAQQHSIYTSLKKIKERLPKEQFLQVHRSFIIQLEQIDSLEENSVTIDDKHIPVSKTYMPELLERLNLL
jgi:two-component system response regulator LytT